MSIDVIDNGDGTVTLSSTVEEEIQVLDAVEDLVQLSASNVSLLFGDIIEIADISEFMGGRIVWDKVGERVYESGLDRGVLYLPDGSAVPWNGLTAVIESFDKTTTPVYFDGMKISDNVVLGDFAASLKAVTYPDEFCELEGLGKMIDGIYAGDQPPKTFALSYRTQIGNDLDGDSKGYKIHLLYNVTAIPKDKTYATLSTDPSLVEFEWELTAVPEEVEGFRPTSHFIINTLELDPLLLLELEEILYGGTFAVASLIPMSEFVTKINEWSRIKIIDHGDGTWSAVSGLDGFIFMLTEDLFQIVQANAVYLDEVTYVISDTIDPTDVPQITIVDHGDGTWTASTDHDILINVASDGSFEIFNANAIFLGPDSYQISDTEDD